MVSNQQFRLKWNNHRNTVLQEFETLLHNNSFVDCTIGADGKYLKAHKIVLSACSPYLQNVFNEHFDKHPVILLKDVSFKELKCMIDYMYCGEVNISECELPSFLRTAQSLKIKGLAEDINDYDSSSDNEQQESNTFPENDRSVEANVEIHDDEPPVKKSTPSLISASANNSLAGRKRKTPNSVPITGKPNTSNQAKTVHSNTSISSKPAEVNSSSNASENESERTQSTTTTESSVTKTENTNSNTKKTALQSDSQEHKSKDVKEEPIDTDADNEDNSSYEYMNNPCDDSDLLNEDSESNCATSGNKYGDVSIGNVSSYNESDANGYTNGGSREEPKLGKGCRIKKIKKEQYDEEGFMYEYKAKNGERRTTSGMSKARKNKEVVKIIRRLKGSANKSTSHHHFVSSFRKENTPTKCDFIKQKPEYPCDECGKIYRWKEGLAMHKRLYCGQQPRFECPHCDKKTFQKINLDTHISTYHANETI